MYDLGMILQGETRYQSCVRFNPLTPKSDKHLISPSNITTESHINVMKIKEMITNSRNS